jgi:hypothetical protein
MFTVKKISVDKGCAFLSFLLSFFLSFFRSFFVLNGIFCAQFVIKINNTNLGDTVPLTVVFFCGTGMGFSTNMKGSFSSVSFLFNKLPPPLH